MSRRLGGRFVLGDRIGSGGMSTVFAGTDEVLDRPVAIKVLKPQFVGSEVGARFRREGRTAARLSHPNIVQVYDAGEDELDGREASYIVMEYVSGGDLKELVREQGPLPEKRLSRIGSDVAAGLAHAHDRGVIHRDVKPQNVLLDEYGQPKLTDFGIARALGSTQATQTGAYLGTALYSAPEQLRGEDVTPKSDVYSLGITLYEAATGSPPFSGTPVEVIGQQLSGVLQPPSQRGASIGAGLEARIMACLETEPSQRPRASEVRQQLLQIGAAPASPGVRGGKGAGVLGGLAALGIVGSLKAAGKSGGRGVSRTARSLGGAGAEVSSNLQERLRGRSRTAPTVSAGRFPSGTIVLPTRTFGSRRVGTPLLALAAAVVLLVAIVGFAVALGSGSPDSAGGAAASAPSRDAAVQEGPGSTGDGADGGGADGGSLTATAAGEKVAETYLSLTRQEYAEAYDNLSSDYRQAEYPNLNSWTRDQSDLRAMRFEGTPQTSASDGEATVEGAVEVIWSNGSITSENVVWSLIEEGGEWKIAGIESSPRFQGAGQNPGGGAGGGEEEEEGEDDD